MPGNPASHFGKQLRKERLARGWSLDQLSARVGIAAGHLSRIENGRRPPTESVAAKADEAFPDRRGWFAEYYEESKSWTPPGFRDWPEYENKSARLSVWAPGIIHGLLQTADYAQALLQTFPEASNEIVGARLKSRMERQARVFERDDPPRVWFIIDHAALYRMTGSPDVMAAQMSRLTEVAQLPHVALQVHPAIAHPATQSGFLVTDDAAYTEHVLGGLVFTEDQSVSALASLFDTLRAESYRVSESAAIITKAGTLWTGERAATQGPTAETA